jgi:hypothetical protein
MTRHIDKPEPRWQALLALVAVAGIYLALPRSLIVGPTWLLPAIIGVSLAPTIVAHRTGRHSFNHVLGIVNGSLITVALIGSVFLLVRSLPSHAEPPLRLLLSGAELWVTNVLVFALWYWRLDGGGPTTREARDEFGSRTFFFHKCRSTKSNAQDSARITGILGSSTIFLSRSRRAQPLVLPTRHYWPRGQKCWRWCRPFSR